MLFWEFDSAIGIRSKHSLTLDSYRLSLTYCKWLIPEISFASINHSVLHYLSPRPKGKIDHYTFYGGRRGASGDLLLIWHLGDTNTHTQTHTNTHTHIHTHARTHTHTHCLWQISNVRPIIEGVICVILRGGKVGGEERGKEGGRKWDRRGKEGERK